MKVRILEIKFTILSDNIPGKVCSAEWGLSIYIEYNNKKILLDTGASELFARNAELLGIDISAVDYCVLSHAHYDHSDGMEEFFKLNKKAKMYLRKSCKENCYSLKEEGMDYIGIHRGWLEQYADRLEYIDGKFQLADGVKLLPHTIDMTVEGKKAKMFIEQNEEFFPELFNHEQSMVFETDRGIAIFNSCCHGGADNIVKEIQMEYPEKKILGIVGGFHLFRSTNAEVEDFSKRLLATGVEKVVTGHCTGDTAIEILKNILGNKVTQTYAGMSINI